ncbi:MAG: carboxylating nicotinate-nucleotide diphosphorylase [Abditibacteriota bacterium]|nr:carboxylating nicotinate-nucleotide diphosphorylase [Abditibacteriota bacterium]
MYLDRNYIYDKVKEALREDAPYGDITSQFTIDPETRSRGRIWSKSEGVLAGIEVAKAAFDLADPEGSVVFLKSDGDRLNYGDVICEVEGTARGILTAERIALNFLQRMSGIATMTRTLVDAVSHTKARIVDTRKTTPLLRMFEKYAVRCGGGINHRTGLSDGILIKDNHIIAAGGITRAVEKVRNKAPHTLKIELEIKSLAQLQEALDAGADIVMLDNFAPEDMKKAVNAAGGKALLEASGGINADTVRAVAETGVDIISVGALTHSVKALDISLDLDD